MRATPILLIVMAAQMAFLAAAPAQAQSRQELDQRLSALENQLRARPDDAAAMNYDRINALEAQIRTLTGQVEELQYENRQLRQRVEGLQEDMLSAMRAAPAYGPSYDDFGAGSGGDDVGNGATADPNAPTRLGGRTAPPAGDRDFAIVDPNDPFAEQRRGAIRPLGAPPAGGAGGAMDGPGAPGEAPVETADGGLNVAYSSTGDSPDLLFARGRTRLFDGSFVSALEAFAEFLDVAPDDPRAGEVWFWVGSIYRTEEQPQRAADALVKSLQADEDGVMAPEAMVQLGAALAEMGQTQAACQTLDEAPRRYPGMDPSVRNTATRERRNAGC